MRRWIMLLSMLSFLCTTPVSAADHTRNGQDYHVALQQNTGQVIELAFTLPDVDVGKSVKGNQTFSVIDFDGGVRTTKKGFAAVPYVHAAVELPPEGGFHLEIEESEYTDIELDHPLLPSKGVLYRNQDPAAIPYEVDPDSVVDGWYPEELVTAKDPFIFRDVRGTAIYLHPFRYNAARKTLRVYQRVVVRVVTDPALPAVNPKIFTNRPVTIEMDSIYHDLFLNYADNRQAKGTRAIGEMGDILVLHTSRDASAITPYLQWKREKGFTVQAQQLSAGSNAGSAIQSAYAANPNLLYVQLVGDFYDISSDTTSYGEPTDPMLGCVAGSDYFPDLIIGRFSADTATEVTTQINKAINYEKTPDLNGTWYASALGIGSSEGPGDDGEYDYEHIEIIDYYKLQPFTYTNVTEAYDSSSASTVSYSVDQGVSIINYTGHGTEYGWMTTGFGDYDVYYLSNGNRLPVIISVACLNGAFHYTECFAESWLKQENGGAVAVLMSTISQPWEPPMRGQDYMNDLLTGGYNYDLNPGYGINTTEGRTTFGSIVFNGLILMYTESSGASDLETLQTWTLFGDAALQVRTKTPTAIESSSLTASTGQPFSTTITSAQGSPVPGALVSLQQNDQVFSGLTDNSGNITINHQLNTGSATLVISGFNLETEYHNITVGGGPTPNIPPTADFIHTINGLSVSFTDMSTDSDGTIATRSWDFGDGSTSPQTNPVHTYAAAGTYTATLTVTDDAGATGTKSVSIILDVTPPPNNELINGQPRTVSGAYAEWQHFFITVPAGAANLVVQISGGTGDADLYTQFGAQPTLSVFDCRPYLNGNNETCTISNPQAGEHHVSLYGYQAFSNVQVMASY